MKTKFKILSKVSGSFTEINEMDIDIQFIPSTYVVIYDNLRQCNNTYIVGRVVVDLTNENPIQIVYLKNM